MTDNDGWIIRDPRAPVTLAELIAELAQYRETGRRVGHLVMSNDAAIDVETALALGGFAESQARTAVIADVHPPRMTLLGVEAFTRNVGGRQVCIVEAS